MTKWAQPLLSSLIMYVYDHYFRRYGESMFMDSRYELNEDFIVLEGLDPNQMYEIRVVAVDGEFHTASDIEEFTTYNIGVVSL